MWLGIEFFLWILETLFCSLLVLVSVKNFDVILNSFPLEKKTLFFFKSESFGFSSIYLFIALYPWAPCTGSLVSIFLSNENDCYLFLWHQDEIKDSVETLLIETLNKVSYPHYSEACLRVLVCALFTHFPIYFC